MANTTGEASVISLTEMVQQDQASDWATLADGRSLAEPLEAASKQELVTAIEEKRNSKRWHALDQLLRVSFAMISPAYLFNSFPPVR
jgi:hypothetical protein